MKIIFVILIALCTMNSHANDGIDWIRPIDDMAAGPIFSSLKSIGGQIQSSSFYIQFKINEIYAPQSDGWDFAHTHNVGYTLRILKNLEIYNGIGYAAYFMEVYDPTIRNYKMKRKNQTHYNFGMGWNYRSLKVILGFDSKPMEIHIGILLNGYRK